MNIKHFIQKKMPKSGRNKKKRYHINRSDGSERAFPVHEYILVFVNHCVSCFKFAAFGHQVALSLHHSVYVSHQGSRGCVDYGRHRSSRYAHTFWEEILR